VAAGKRGSGSKAARGGRRQRPVDDGESEESCETGDSDEDESEVICTMMRFVRPMDERCVAK